MTRPIEERIRLVRWEQYAGPDLYRPGELVEALIELASLDQCRAGHGLENNVNKVLFAVGNNHAGTYYPAILEAADIFIEIEQESGVPAARACARAVLNELHYFSAEVGAYTGHSAEQIESFVRGRLEPYADGA
jgi:hypothetical protein